MLNNCEFPFVQIRDVNPSLNSYMELYMLENFGATIKLSSKYPPEHLKVQIWTNALTKLNSEGNWHGIDFEYQSREAEDSFIFQGGFMPTSEGFYEFTYRVGLEDSDRWQWVGDFKQNGYLKVEPPSPLMKWTQGPSYVEFLPQVYVGNFIAASQAEQLGIDAVLNLATEFNLTFPSDSNIVSKKIGLLDGSQHPISDEVLLEAVNWIDEQVKRGKKKVLINCRAGIGRSGSASIAYCFYKHPDWSYQQTLDYIWSKKPDIYPHKHLQESLERLFPREKK